ncbi:MAG TPA: phosphatidate cytidylyltransferase [Alteraurantiacibacter sp.]
MTESQPRKSDLGVRTLSAIVMLAVAGVAIWLGGIVLDAFIALVAAVCLGELAMLVAKASSGSLARLVGWVVGAAYIAAAAYALIGFDLEELVLVIGLVIATDTGAYFAGRAIGGPKIAPKISPSKTWAGLTGGMTAAALWMGAAIYVIASMAESGQPTSHVAPFAIGGAVLAVAAQAGDFFESWLKRRAGVKDSSRLIPGHGGVFDRVDGLLPVAILSGIAMSFAP